MEIPYDSGDLKLNVSHDALFLQEVTHSSKDNFFQNWRNFDNFQCIDRMMSIHCNLLQSKSTEVRRVNGKRLLNLELQFEVCGKVGSKGL